MARYPAATAAQLTAANPTLPAGQLMIETDTGRFKIGDGSTVWASLPYLNTRPNSAETINAAWTFAAAPTFSSDAIFGGAVRLTVMNRNVNVNLGSSSRCVNECDASAGAFTITITATTSNSNLYIFTKTDSTANPVSIALGTALQGFTGTIKLYRQGDSIMLRTTGTSGVVSFVGGTINPFNPSQMQLPTALGGPAAGDTLRATDGTANIARVFATGATVPANWWVPGARLYMTGWGVFTVGAASALTINPTVMAGGISGAKVADAGTLTLPASTRNRFYFNLSLKCVTSGSSGTILSFGNLVFATAASAALPVLAGPSGTNDGTANNPVTLTTQSAKLFQLAASWSGTNATDQVTVEDIDAYFVLPAAAAA